MIHNVVEDKIMTRNYYKKWRLHMLRYAIIHLVAVVVGLGSFCNADDLSQITARLEGLKNIQVSCTYSVNLTPPDFMYDKIERLNEKEKNKHMMTIGTLLEEQDFSYLNGTAKYTSMVSEDKIRHFPETKIEKLLSRDIAFPGDRVEFLQQMEGKEYDGIVMPIGRFELPIQGIEIGLGLRGWRSTWLKSDDLKKMEINDLDKTKVIVSLVDSLGGKHEWVYDRSNGYALICYRRLVSPGNFVNIQYDMSDFTDVDGIIVPNRIDYKVNYREKGIPKISEAGTYQVNKYKIHDLSGLLHRNNIDWPDGAIIRDQRTGIAFKYDKGEAQILLKKDENIADIAGENVDIIVEEILNRKVTISFIE